MIKERRRTSKMNIHIIHVFSVRQNERFQYEIARQLLFKHVRKNFWEFPHAFAADTSQK